MARRRRRKVSTPRPEAAQPKMSFRDAMAHCDTLDLPDGAYWAMAHELAGLDYGDGFDLLVADDMKD